MLCFNDLKGRQKNFKKAKRDYGALISYGSKWNEKKATVAETDEIIRGVANVDNSDMFNVCCYIDQNLDTRMPCVTLALLKTWSGNTNNN